MSSNKVDGRQRAAIIRAVEHHISPRNKNARSFLIKVYSNWYCGVTNDASIRKYQHQREKKVPALYFKYWDAGSSKAAREIEDYFHSKGMGDKSSPGNVKPNSKYFYIFKWKSHLLDDIDYLVGFIE